tara:strand:+ start:1280 stop:1681 length:402 start_codon:yes stop_codon:yes gene_type:complete
MIGIKVLKNNDDIKKVAKVILINEKKEVLLLKRSNYLEKYANEWDLPGGHLKLGESLVQGLTREVKEETGLSIKNPTYFTKIEDHLHFFTALFTKQKILLSSEHTEYKFFNKEQLDIKEKFQKIAFNAIEGSK